MEVACTAGCKNNRLIYLYRINVDTKIYHALLMNSNHINLLHTGIKINKRYLTNKVNCFSGSVGIQDFNHGTVDS
jgi:hypothetical protein